MENNLLSLAESPAPLGAGDECQPVAESRSKRDEAEEITPTLSSDFRTRIPSGIPRSLLRGRLFKNARGFLQSPEWEKLQYAMGRKTWRVDGRLLIQHRLPGGFNYLYCPRPQVVGKGFFSQVRVIVDKEGSIFMKIDPNCGFIIPENVRCAKSDFLQPRQTVVLDLRKTEDDLLKQMHEKTRYNIRLAEKHGVEVKIFQHPSSGARADLFWDFMLKTAKRAGFSPHVKSYYEKLFRAGTESDFSNELFLAEFQGQILAMILVNFYRPSLTATYLHGASVREHKEVMASYLLHWRAIEEAKKREFYFYDFWGIDEVKWPGVTKFKLGFGGSVVEYPRTVDIIYKPVWYKIYRLVKKLK